MSSRPTRIAIVGAGPAGFYTAAHLLKDKERSVEVDLFDRLPTPWGLVRGGVAPDHPKIKTVSRAFEKTAADPRFFFHGGVEVGRHLAHEELASHFDAVVYAYGASLDRPLGIPGEHLPGSHAATEFVGWYNGHPDFRDREFDLSARRAVVVGNGNVALDVARMLALDVGELRATDTADHALEALEASQIEEIVVLGRRGPLQAAYTHPELLELGELIHADVHLDPVDVELDPASQAELDGEEVSGTVRRSLETLREYAQRTPSGKKRRIVLRFLVSPVEILGSDRVEGVRIARNELVRGDDGRVRAQVTDATEDLEAQLVLRAVGYRGEPIAGVPFDERTNTVPNEGGRVVEPATGEPIPGLYVTGWARRGPSGVIGTNKKCAQETASALLEDLEAGRLAPDGSGSREDLEALLAERQPDRVDYAGWEAIDAHERERGAEQDRPRVKLTRMEELTEVARGSVASR